MINNISMSGTSNQTSETNENIKTSKYQISTSDSFSLNDSYRIKLPSNIDVLSSVSKIVASLSNSDVRNYVINVLDKINKSLQNINIQGDISNYLSKINVIEQTDLAALIEWNFKNFRVGFSIEPDLDESSFVIVSKDENKGSFFTITEKIGSEINAVIDKIVEYVINNT